MLVRASGWGSALSPHTASPGAAPHSRPSRIQGEGAGGPSTVHGVVLRIRGGGAAPSSGLAAKITPPAGNGWRRQRVSLRLGGLMVRIDPAAGIVALAARRLRAVPGIAGAVFPPAADFPDPPGRRDRPHLRPAAWRRKRIRSHNAKSATTLLKNSWHGLPRALVQ